MTTAVIQAIDVKAALGKLIRTGRPNAITSQELAHRLDTDERSIRLLIRDMIADGVPVASSNAKPMGFFIAETREEAEQYMGTLKSRLVEDAYRRRDFKRASTYLWPERQLNLF